MIRYKFGSAPKAEIAEIRKAVEHISALAPVDQDVTVEYPVDLPKDIEHGKMMAYAQGNTDTETNTIQISPLVFHPPQEFENQRDAMVQDMPLNHGHGVPQFVVAHEWGHIVTVPRYEEYKRIFLRNPGLTSFILFFSDMSTYGVSSFGEAMAEAFAEWYLSKGKTQNNSAQKIASALHWRTDF